MAYRITSDQKKIAALKKKLEELKRPIDLDTALELGFLIVDEMLNLISNGVSTVEGTGRMPAYKAQAKANTIRKLAKSASGRGDTGRAKQLRSKAGRKLGYPYSVQREFPDKRDRPVNLKLSGDFLSDLFFKIASDRYGFFPKIGYGPNKNSLSWKKESGHAEGVNGQPKRPTIPDNQSKFAQRIQRIISSLYRKRVRELANK